MTINFLHKRSATADKRPTAANLDVGELALNYNDGDPGVYFEDDNGDVRKVGPVSVGASAPNSSPAVGGSAGNSVGEGWLDTSVTPNVLKVWDGSAWVSAVGTVSTPLNDGEIFVGNSSNETEADAFNDVLTAQAGIDGSATTATRFTLNDNNAIFDGTIVAGGALLDDNGTLFFEEATANGSNYVAFQAPSALTTTTVFRLPDGDGTNGQSLVTNGSGILSWANTAGVPGGADTQVQFNSSGSFDGNANFTYNATDDQLTVGEVLGNLDGSVRFTAQAGEDIDFGEVVYISGASGDTPIVSLAQSNSASTMPAYGFAAASVTSGNELQIVTFGSIEGSGATPIDTSSESVNDVVYVSPTTAGAWTTTKPTGEGNLLQNIGRVQRVQNNNGVIKVGGAGRTNATPNLNDGNIFVGNGSNEAVADSFLDVLSAQAGIVSTATSTAFTINNTGVIVAGDMDVGNVGLTDASSIGFFELTANGNNIISFKAPDAIPNTVNFTLPDGDGTAGQFLSTDGSSTLSWASPGAAALTNGNIFVGNAGGTAADVSMSGDVTIDNTGATTIANDAVTTAKIIDDAVTGDKIADNVALAGNPTTTTQTAGANNTTIATTAYADSAVAASQALNSANIFVGNGSNVATGVAMSGDTTIDNAGAVTIANDAVTTVKILDDNVTGDKIADDVALAGNPTTTTQADTDNSTRIATTAYVRTRVDNALQGLDSKQSVRAASTGDLTLSGTQTVDGIALSAGERVLVKDQASSEENGIYEVAAGAWSRTDDANTWDELVGAFVFVESGTVNADAGYVTQTVAGGTLGTTAIPWTQFSSAGQVTAGAGLTKTGSQIDVITADASRIVVNADDIDLATTGVTGGTYQSVTVDTYGRVTAGTNPTTFAGYNISDTSANLASAITDETGTGSLVFAGSPALTGTPTAPTASAGDNSTTIATTAYVDAADGNKLDTTLNSAQVFVGNASNEATGVTLSGDATIDNAGALTIANDAVTTAKILDDNVTGDKIADNVALAGNPTTTTQGAGTNNTTIATTAYADTAVANIAGTYVDVAGDAMTGNLTMNAQSEIRFADADSSNFVAFEAPATVTADVTFTLPDGDGTSGQVLSTDGSGALSWATVSGGTNALNNGDIYVGNASNEATGVTMSGDVTIDNTGAATIANDVALGGNPTTTTQSAGTNNTTIATTAYTDAAVAAISGTYVDVTGDAMTGNLTMNAQSEIRFADADSSNYIALESPATVAANVTFVLPDSDGTAGQRLITDGSGNLAWASAAAGTLNSGDIYVGNGSNVATGVTMSGDVTIDNTGATTIANDAVTTAKIIDDAVTGDKIANDVALAGNPTATTQTAGDNSTRIATTAYADAAVTASQALTSANIFVGNATNVATGVALSGDATIDNAGALTIANDAVTTAKILDDNVTGDKIADDVALAGNPTTTTQSAGTNNTTIATTAYADTAVANIAGTYVDVAGDTMTGALILDDTTLQIQEGTDTLTLGASALTAARSVNFQDAAGDIALVDAGSVDSRYSSSTLNAANIFVGNGSNVATGVAMSGDVTIDNAGATTIANDAVTTVKIADDAVTFAKLENVSSGNIIVGDASNEAASVAVSGDVTMSNTGVVDIIDDVNLGGNPTTTTQTDTDNSTRVATTAYVHTRVDTALQGLSSKESVAAASTGNLTLSGTQTIDGISLSAGDRVLVKDQTTVADNGIYEVAAGSWSRTTDADTWDELVGAFVFVTAGTVNADTGYTTQIVAGGTLGTTDIPWTQFSSAGQVSAGAGLTKTGSTIDVITADSSRIVVNSNDIDLATTGVAAGTYRSVTTDTYGRITAGTNPTTFAGYGISDTSANLAAALTDETGTGSVVFSADPALTGSPTAPTQGAGTNNTTIATTAYADSAVSAISTTYVAVAGDTMTGALILDDTSLQIQEGADTLTLTASALTADRAVNFQDAAGDIALVGAGSVDTRYVAVAGDTMTGNLEMAANILPDADSTRDLGSASLRFANVYTGDLHLKNDRGDWSMIEEEDALTLRNNVTGKVYNIMMQERV